MLIMIQNIKEIPKNIIKRKIYLIFQIGVGLVKAQGFIWTFFDEKLYCLYMSKIIFYVYRVDVESPYTSLCVNFFIF